MEERDGVWIKHTWVNTGKLLSFPVVFEKEENGEWFCEFPDFEGLHAHGRTFEEAKKEAKEVLSIWLYGARFEKDMDLPEATPISNIKSKKDQVVLMIEESREIKDIEERIDLKWVTDRWTDDHPLKGHVYGVGH